MTRAALIAEKDPTMLRVISRTVEQAGLDVMAGCDRAHDLVELVRRFGADVIITERALLDGAIDPHVETIKASAPSASIIVFTPYPPEPSTAALHDPDVTVVLKPDFDALSEAIVAAGVAQQRATTTERRSPRRIVEPHEPVPGSIDGVEPATTLIERLNLIHSGDTVVNARFVVGPTLGAETVTASDAQRRLGEILARMARPVDVVIELEDDTYTTLLLGGDERAGRAYAERVKREWTNARLPGRIEIGAAMALDHETPFDTLSRSELLPVVI